MLYYTGTGKEFKKEECKEYKTEEGAMKAAEKKGLTVWDEDGNAINQLSDDATDSGLQTEAVPDNATQTGTGMIEKKEERQDGQDTDVVSQRKMKVTVICEGSLNLRRSPQYGNDNICGRAVKGQSYQVEETIEVDGKKFVQTVGGIYLSGEPEHVRFEQL